MNITKHGHTVHKAMPSENSPLNGLNKFTGRTFLAGMSEIRDGFGYLYIGGGDLTKKIAFRYPDKKDKHLVVLDVDGCPTTAIKMYIRNLRAMQKSHCVTQFYGLLNQWLSEGDIKTFFYDIWVKHHNYGAIKQQRRDDCLAKKGVRVNSGRHICTSRWG